MMDKNDFDFVKENSKEIIEGSGELITRRRLKTSVPPDSYDSDFGEVVKEGENEYLVLDFRGKVFWNVTEKIMQEIFGAGKTADAYVHIPDATDVQIQDVLVIRGLEYEVKETIEMPLRGMRVLRLLIRSAQ
jgi:hypothetical protein